MPMKRTDAETNKKKLLGARKPLRQGSRGSNRDNHIDDGFRAKKIRNRKDEDGCTVCLRGTLHCYNVCILVVGCAALGVGIWLLVTDFGARKVTPIVGNQLYEITTYLLIAGGGAVALLAFCGCCGTIREDKCVLSFYGTTLAIVLILLGVSCGLAFFFRNVLSVKMQDEMEEVLIRKYGVDTRTNTENKRITDSWDSMQRQLQCCGVTGNVSSHKSWHLYKNTIWFFNEKQKSSNSKFVPESCCKGSDIAMCTGQKLFEGPPIIIPPKREDVIRNSNPHLYTTGCYDKVIQHLEKYAAVVGAVSAIVPVFLIFGIIISFCLCARVSGNPADEEADL